MENQMLPNTNIQDAKKIGGRSWMLGVIGVYSTFALGTLAVVGFTFTQKVELVSKQHYEEGVKFQSKIDNSYRAAALKEALSWKISNDATMLEISYPASFRASEAVSGKITFFRPSSTDMDKVFKVSIDANGKQYIPLSEFQSGFWMISLDVNADGQGYYKETTLTR
jgi:nitrogen fixation protein FixH